MSLIESIGTSYVLLISGIGARGLYERLMIWLGPGFWRDTGRDVLSIPRDIASVFPYDQGLLAYGRYWIARGFQALAEAGNHPGRHGLEYWGSRRRWPLLQAPYDGSFARDQGHVALHIQEEAEIEEPRVIPRATHLFQILIPPHLDAAKYQGEDHPFACCMRNLERLRIPHQRRAKHCARVKDLIEEEGD